MEDLQQQVSVGFKVTGLQKREIIVNAHRMGVDVSTYLRGLIMSNHEKIKRFVAVPDALVIAPDRVGEVCELLQRLLRRYPGRNCTDIIAAALYSALENEQHLVSFKIKKYLP